MDTAAKGLYAVASDALCDALDLTHACKQACAAGDRRAAVGRYGQAWEAYGRVAELLPRLPVDEREAIEETRVSRLNRVSGLLLLARCGEWLGGGPWLGGPA